MSQSALEQKVKQTLQVVLEHEDTPLSNADRVRLAAGDRGRHSRIRSARTILHDPDITEVMVNGPDQIYVERRGQISLVPARFGDENHLRRTIDKIVARVGRRVDEASPMVDARLPDGSRVNAVVPPIALDGSVLTIRKFAADPFTLEDLIDFGTMTAPPGSSSRPASEADSTSSISGGTGSGKTTTLNVLSSAIPEDERIVTIEDAAELQLHQDTCCAWRPGHRTSRDAVRSRFANSSATRCGCGRTGSSSVRSATVQHWTCSRP